MKTIQIPRRLAKLCTPSFVTVFHFFILQAAAYCQAPWMWQDNPAIPAEPRNHISYVRGFDGQHALLDWQFKKDIAGLVNGHYARIDVVMQQNNGGGFLNDVAAAVGVPRTLVSSSAWNETSWNVIQAPNTPSALWNFTNEWQDAARSSPRRGIREIAYRAREQDWVGPVSQEFQPTTSEHPQYYSPDKPPGGPNDTATLGAVTGARQFAIIAGWGRSSALRFRHQVDAARVYDVLLNEYQIPANQIAVLWDNGNYNLSAPGVIRPGAQNLGQVPVNLLTSRINWLAALQGAEFGVAPGPHDKLLVYFTGQGSHGEWRRAEWQAQDVNQDNQPDGNVWRVDWRRTTDTFKPPPTSAAAVEMGITDPTGIAGVRPEDSGQLNLNEGLSFDLNDVNHANLRINGIDVTPLIVPVEPQSLFDIPPRSETDSSLSTPFVYKFQITDPLLLALNSDYLTIELDAVSPSLVNRQLFAAISFQVEGREYFLVNVPEPSLLNLFMLLLGTVVGIGRRGRN
jgi:hypothetical protein